MRTPCAGKGAPSHPARPPPHLTLPHLALRLQSLSSMLFSGLTPFSDYVATCSYGKAAFDAQNSRVLTVRLPCSGEAPRLPGPAPHARVGSEQRQGAVQEVWAREGGAAGQCATDPVQPCGRGAGAGAGCAVGPRVGPRARAPIRPTPCRFVPCPSAAPLDPGLRPRPSSTGVSKVTGMPWNSSSCSQDTLFNWMYEVGDVADDHQYDQYSGRHIPS
jgi:hypothetical protein